MFALRSVRWLLIVVRRLLFLVVFACCVLFINGRCVLIAGCGLPVLVVNRYKLLSVGKLLLLLFGVFVVCSSALWCVILCSVLAVRCLLAVVCVCLWFVVLRGCLFAV